MSEESVKTIEELQMELAKINQELYKIRRQRVLAKCAELKRAHETTLLVESRRVCFEESERLGRINDAMCDLEILEVLLDLDY